MTRVLLLALLLAAAAGAGGTLALDERPPVARCGGPGLAAGEWQGDGRFAAVVRRGCADAGTKRCRVGDGTGPISEELVERGVHQSCVADNHAVGVGLSTVPGYVVGECTARATTEVSGIAPARTERPRRPCG